MSFGARDSQYATDNPRAFAHLVAGLFAQRNGQLAVAEELYTVALGLDARYHKAFNNEGLLVLDAGARAYVEGAVGASRAEHLWLDAQAMFLRAIDLDGKVAEYFYNYGTVLSYRGRLALRQEDTVEALALQRRSVVEYTRALESLAAEPDVRTGRPTKPWLWSPRVCRRKYREYEERVRYWVSRMAFGATIELALATSLALKRWLTAEPQPSDEESNAVHAAAALRGQDPMIDDDPRLDYNLGCYYVASRQTDLAMERFNSLRAVHPGIGDRARSDPDLVDASRVLRLFQPDPGESKPAAPLFY
jgi:tetratricopeptide (TPR) repeat protein